MQKRLTNSYHTEGLHVDTFDIPYDKSKTVYVRQCISKHAKDVWIPISKTSTAETEPLNMRHDVDKSETKLSDMFMIFWFWILLVHPSPACEH